jgi:hypothetical protein
MKVLYQGNQEDRIFIFDCSGRRFSALCDVIGIGSDLHVYQGYDGGLRIRNPDGQIVQDAFAFTKAERAELATHMIKQWERFRDSGPIVRAEEADAED